MARVTVEDCILNIPNRFELVTLAAQRAKQISSGLPLTVDRDNDKDAVVSLREIADETIDLDVLEGELVPSYQRLQPIDRIDDNEEDDVPQVPQETVSEGDVAEVFEDAEQHIAESPEGEASEGMSFADENITPED